MKLPVPHLHASGKWSSLWFTYNTGLATLRVVSTHGPSIKRVAPSVWNLITNNGELL